MSMTCSQCLFSTHPVQEATWNYQYHQPSMETVLDGAIQCVPLAVKIVSEMYPGQDPAVLERQVYQMISHMKDVKIYGGGDGTMFQSGGLTTPQYYW